uniref:Uncharacterized protein n=1 Tax=Triticum urartu TaxID=4572 RepID=A0A8R7QEA0_TRIUA
MAEGCRGSAGMAAEGLDLEMHHGLPSARIAFDLNLNVDLSLFARPISVENFALVVYEGQVAVGGADKLVPPAVTESVAADMEMGAIVIHEGP